MDAIIIIIAFLAILIPFIIAKLYWWVAFWIAIVSVLGIFELASYIKDRKTISQKFWIWRKTAKTWQKLAILGGMVGFWVYLLIHLFFE